MTSQGDDPPRPASLPPGYDEEDPYVDEDLSDYPDWWRQNIEQFREYDLRPYRPPQFSDGKFTPVVISNLETEYNISIQFRTTNPRYGDDWEIWLDGECIATVGRYRDGDGFSVYEISSNRFRSLIEDNL